MPWAACASPTSKRSANRGNIASVIRIEAALAKAASASSTMVPRFNDRPARGSLLPLRGLLVTTPVRELILVDVEVHLGHAHREALLDVRHGLVVDHRTDLVHEEA